MNAATELVLHQYEKKRLHPYCRESDLKYQIQPHKIFLDTSGMSQLISGRWKSYFYSPRIRADGPIVLQRIQELQQLEKKVEEKYAAVEKYESYAINNRRNIERKQNKKNFSNLSFLDALKESDLYEGFQNERFNKYKSNKTEANLSTHERQRRKSSKQMKLKFKNKNSTRKSEIQIKNRIEQLKHFRFRSKQNIASSSHMHCNLGNSNTSIQSKLSIDARNHYFDNKNKINAISSSILEGAVQNSRFCNLNSNLTQQHQNIEINDLSNFNQNCKKPSLKFEKKVSSQSVFNKRRTVERMKNSQSKNFDSVLRRVIHNCNGKKSSNYLNFNSSSSIQKFPYAGTSGNQDTFYNNKKVYFAEVNKSDVNPNNSQRANEMGNQTLINLKIDHDITKIYNSKSDIPSFEFTKTLSNCEKKYLKQFKIAKKNISASYFSNELSATSDQIEETIIPKPSITDSKSKDFVSQPNRIEACPEEFINISLKVPVLPAQSSIVVTHPKEEKLKLGKNIFSNFDSFQSKSKTTNEAAASHLLLLPQNSVQMKNASKNSQRKFLKQSSDLRITPRSITGVRLSRNMFASADLKAQESEMWNSKKTEALLETQKVYSELEMQIGTAEDNNTKKFQKDTSTSNRIVSGYREEDRDKNLCKWIPVLRHFILEISEMQTILKEHIPIPEENLPSRFAEEILKALFKEV